MTVVVERLMNLLCATIVALNTLRAVGATVEDMLMGEGHENRSSQLHDDQSNYRYFFYDVHCVQLNVESR